MPIVTNPPVEFDVANGPRDDQNGSHYFGPFEVGAALYAVLEGGAQTKATVYKSTDGGATWHNMDAGHSPALSLNPFFGALDMVLIGAVFSILYVDNSFPSGNLRIITFDTATDTFGAPSVVGPAPGSCRMPRLAAFSNGDLCVAYFDTSLPGFGLLVFSGGVWGASSTFVANNTATDLVMGPDDIGRFFYFNKAAPGINVFMRTFTQGGVLSAQSAVFSSSYLANTGIDFWAEFPVGRAVIWNNKLILPYYGNPDGSGKQAGIYVGDPYTAPVWSFLLADTLAWAMTEFDAYGFAFIDGGNNLYLFWCSIDSANSISQIFLAKNTGAGFAAPVLFYDQATNPPLVGTPEPPVHTLSAFLLSNGHLAGITAINDQNGACIGYFLGGAAAAALTINCNNPPGGSKGVAYSHALSASGGTPAYTFAIIAGALPPGLALNAGTGVISGIPTLAGVFNFTVQVTDSAAATASVACTITIKGCLQ